MTISTLSRPHRLLVLVLIAAPLVCGCGSKEEIRSYTVAKEDEGQIAPLAQPARPVEITESTDRMMGAILPAGGQTWYFKVVGPTAAMDKNAEKITEFFKTIRVNEGAARPEWKAPDGWEEQVASGMRAATFLIPADGKPLDLSVIPLPTTGAPGELMSNVNRWRGQLQLPPVDERGLTETTEEIKVSEATMTLVDLRGQFSAGSMTAPFASGGPFSGGARPSGNAPFANGAGQQDASPAPDAPKSTDLPPGHPPAAPGGPVNEPGAAPFTYTAPKLWQEQPPSGLRKVDFDIQDGDRSAEVSVIDLSVSAPNVAKPLDNINRWRGEIGLPPIKEDQVAGVVQKIDVSGTSSDYVELIPDPANPAESQVNKATIAAAVPAGEVIWFFKMRGDRDLVIGQRDNFKSFLESVRFTSADGAGDGN